MMQAYYSNSFNNFVLDDPNRILGILNKGGIEFASQFNDVNIAWDISIPLYQQTVNSLLSLIPDSEKWIILLEYGKNRCSNIST